MMDIARIRKRGVLTLAAGCAISIGGIAFAADVSLPGAPSSAEQSTRSVAEQFAAIQTEYSQKQQEAYQAYVAAAGKSNEERMRAYQEKLPNPVPFAEKALALAKANPSDPIAIHALLFVLQQTRGNAIADLKLNKEALSQLERDDLDNPKIAEAFRQFAYDRSDEGTDFMHLAAEKSSNRDVRGSALYWLARSLEMFPERGGEQKDLAEAKKLFEQVAAKYGDCKIGTRTLGEESQANLYALENLAIGKIAPEIEGKDADGKPIKLSDYAGKVVVIDFWGNW